jgi:uncharacterized protein Yka (UPF0111/DUF47 family)
MLKARDVREHIKAHGEKAIPKMLEALAEQQSVMRQEMLMLAQIQDQMINMLHDMVNVGGVQKEAIAEMLGLKKGKEGNSVSDKLKRIRGVHTGSEEVDTNEFNPLG